ncbi:acyl carrier protein [Streptomyces sp. NPDC002676]
MFEVLRGILVDELQMRADDIVPTATRTEVGLDSVALVELAELLRTRLGIEIQDYELAEAPTLADLARLVAERRRTPATGH